MVHPSTETNVSGYMLRANGWSECRAIFVH